MNEERDPNWQPIDILSEQTRLELLKLIEPTRLEIIEKIATTFKDVMLEDGVSIHQARALDDYEDPKEARLIDSEIRWQEIPDDWIDSFSDVLAFMDAKGLRHAIPAYLIWCLKYNKTGKSSFQSVEYYLRPDDNGIPLARRELFNLLDEAQRKVISEFIQFLDTFIYSV